MSCLQRRFNLALFIVLSALAPGVSAQILIVHQFSKDSVARNIDATTKYACKNIPPEYSDAIGVALSYYPELAMTRIEFRLRKQRSPLLSRAALFSILQRASKRKYIVSISNDTDPRYTPILFSNLSFNAQIGVIGHELSHLSDYNKRKGLYFIAMAISSMNSHNTDRHEYATDKRCIDHGLGYQLLAWSTEVRRKLHLRQWNGVSEDPDNGRERYMKPTTIRSFIKANKIYN